MREAASSGGYEKLRQELEKAPLSRSAGNGYR